MGSVFPDRCWEGWGRRLGRGHPPSPHRSTHLLPTQLPFTLPGQLLEPGGSCTLCPPPSLCSSSREIQPTGEGDSSATLLTAALLGAHEWSLFFSVSSSGSLDVFWFPFLLSLCSVLFFPIILFIFCHLGPSGFLPSIGRVVSQATLPFSCLTVARNESLLPQHQESSRRRILIG